MVSVLFAPFGSREFDFLSCDFFSHSPPFPPAVFTDVLWTFGHITLDMSHFRLHNVPEVTPQPFPSIVHTPSASLGCVLPDRMIPVDSFMLMLILDSLVFHPILSYRTRTSHYSSIPSCSTEFYAYVSPSISRQLHVL